MIMALRPMLRIALWLMLLMSLCVVASSYPAEEKSSVQSLKSSPNRLRTKNVRFTKEKTFSRFTAHRRKGQPGKDYPIFNHIPATRFVCGEIPGRYADPETGCQVWHLCPGGYNHFRHSFLCPNGTIFNERRGICDWWYNVSCELVLRR
ncbi:uncharacterized protein LOC106478089 [Limulus polyphemus]|uniref:Uncharacterized protein LOC106478089 n=1 Tax=Limulus polyphemus TaxID=6850 RepID=A0ABM1S130_LIMPO|nr:uncharacterized protein LOC106478089 [Limulus polyphemus]